MGSGGGSSGGGGGSSGGSGGSSGGSGQIPNPAWVSPVPSWYQSSEVEGGMLPVPEDSIFEIMKVIWSIQFSCKLNIRVSEKPRDLIQDLKTPRFWTLHDQSGEDCAFFISPRDRFLVVHCCTVLPSETKTYKISPLRKTHRSVLMIFIETAALFMADKL
jgi:hypothetical protein